MKISVKHHTASKCISFRNVIIHAVCVLNVYFCFSLWIGISNVFVFLAERAPPLNNILRGAANNFALMK